MSSILLSPPPIEPVSLAEAKAYLRVEHNDDDDVIAALIAGARVHIEALTRRALITQSWRLIRDEWPADGRIAVTPVPLREVLAARVYKLDGSPQAIDTAAFVADMASAPAVLGFTLGAVPSPGRTVGGIEIDVEVGYGDAASDVPLPLRQALRMLLAHWYENRGLLGENGFVPLPQGAAALLAPYRVLTL
jgi:uncharacterized phiE125 gp8 family phage protein